MIVIRYNPQRDFNRYVIAHDWPESCAWNTTHQLDEATRFDNSEEAIRWIQQQAAHYAVRCPDPDWANTRFAIAVVEETQPKYQVVSCDDAS